MGFHCDDRQTSDVSIFFWVNWSNDHLLHCLRPYIERRSCWCVCIMSSNQFPHLDRYLSCSSETELWDWMTSLLKAQVSPFYTGIVSYLLGYQFLGRVHWISFQNCSLVTWIYQYFAHIVWSISQNDDLRPPVMRRHSSSDICKQKFGTMPLVPIRGEESNTNSTMLSANQTLVT